MLGRVKKLWFQKKNNELKNPEYPGPKKNAELGEVWKSLSVLIKNRPIFLRWKCVPNPVVFDGTFEGGKHRNRGSRGFQNPKKKGPRIGLLEGKLLELLGSEDHPTQKSQKVMGPTFWDFLKVNFGSRFANGGEPCNDNHGGVPTTLLHFCLVKKSLKNMATL